MKDMKKEAFIGFDVSKNSHAVAIAEGGRDGEVRGDYRCGLVAGSCR